MPITSLSLTNFRSYSNQEISLNPVATLIIGPNATGKTNLLEALYVLATTKSFRARDGELIHHGGGFYRLEAHIDDTKLSLGYQTTDRGTEKRVRHDGVEQSLVSHLGTIRVVLFEPNDLLLINGGPDRRRRYLDFVLSQTDKRYVKVLSRYKRVLQQRNRLLTNWAGQTDELFAWNIKLTELASEIHSRRQAVISHINRMSSEVYARIAGSPEGLVLTYRGTTDHGDYPTSFLQLLESNLQRDIAAGFTTAGPHRDDFAITFKSSPIVSVASRGEMRTVVLALKLAELAYIEQQTNTKPILLLDDVFSELDDSRRRFLLDTLGEYQSVITTTNADVSDELRASHATVHTSELQRV